MNIFSIRKLLALSAMALTISAVPSTASAGGAIHLDIPGFSIGFHDHDRRYRKRHYRNHKRYKRHYRNRHHNDYYPRRSYNYYDGYRSRGYTRPRYRDNYEYCPTPGYSNRYYRNRGCYSHGDHYHCDG